MSRTAALRSLIPMPAGLVVVPVVVAVLAAGCSGEVYDYAVPSPGTPAAAADGTPASATGGTSAPAHGSGQRERLAAARRAWAAAGITDYDLEVARSCFCLGAAVRATVRHGVPVAVVPLPGSRGEYPATAPPSDLPTTVEALLDAAAREMATADQVDVTYDGLGVPTSIVSQGKLNTADDEITYSATYSRAATSSTPAPGRTSAGGSSTARPVPPSSLSTGMG